MITQDWIAWAAITGNAAIIGWNFELIARNRRLQRLLDADRREALAEREQVTLLNALLMRLCVGACQRQMVPVWKAWAQTMGSISVKVRAESWDGEPPEQNGGVDL